MPISASRCAKIDSMVSAVYPTLCGFQRVGTLNLGFDIPTESRSLPVKRYSMAGALMGDVAYKVRSL